MIAAESLFLFCITSIILSLTPGPDNIFVMTQSALFGRKAGIFITLGLCTGLIFHTSAVALGVAALIQTSAIAFTLLKIAGALYLSYLAWQAFTATAAKLDSTQSNSLTVQQLYRRGIIMNITNPKVTIFFLAFLPQFVTTSNNITLQIIILGGVFMLIAMIIFSLIAILAGHVGILLKQSPQAQIWLNRVAGTVFIGLAINLLLTTKLIN
jgi:threonine/homoserine/homoserine lactone efflux protein